MASRTANLVLADPLPERRLARLLAAFVAAGLVFLVLPGTLVGVWNLITISSRQASGAAPAVWIQAHGHAQLFGWVATFMIGICLYALPKFHGGWIRSIPAGWLMWVLWTGALAVRWMAARGEHGWRIALPLSAGVELAVAVMLLWQTSGPARSRRPWWEALIYTGLLGLIATLAFQLSILSGPLEAPVVPAAANHIVLWLALWTFCLPVAWGFSARFLPSFLGLQAPSRRRAWVGLISLISGAAAASAGRPRLAAALALAAVVLACWSLRVFGRAGRPAKTIGVDPSYPWFARASFGWLVVSAVLAFGVGMPGVEGASRHAFTVGFLATLIFSMGPRILPSFLNSRELWSPRLMRVSLVLLTLGCTLRVSAEPLAYAGVLAAAWGMLPISAIMELTAVLVFALNLGVTLTTRVPVWIELGLVNDSLSIYWLVTSYPETRRTLAKSGIHVPRDARRIPRLLTVREAAEAAGVDPVPVTAALCALFERRLARTLKAKSRTA